jgi:hypothetical protein
MPYFKETYQIEFKRMVWRAFSGQDAPADHYMDIVMGAKSTAIDKRSKEIEVTPGIIPLTEEMFPLTDGRLAMTEWGAFAATSCFSFKADHVNVLGGDLFSDFTEITPHKKDNFCKAWRNALASSTDSENELHPRSLIDKAPGHAVMRLVSKKETVYLNSHLYFACKEAQVVLYAGSSITDLEIEHRMGTIILAVYDDCLVGVMASGDLAYYSAFETISNIVGSNPQLLISVAAQVDPQNEQAIIWQKFMDAVAAKSEGSEVKDEHN